MTAMPLALPATMKMASLPKKVRDEIDLLDRVFRQAMNARPRMMAYEAAAHELRANGLKYSASGVRALMAKYIASGCDPMELKDARKVPHADNKLPAAFVEEVKRRFQRHGRGISAAYVDLISDWRAGKPMPGYTVPPKAYAYTDVPYGWTESNLRKAAKTSAFEKAAMRVGLGYAKSKHGKKLFTTREGLWPMSDVMPDDVDHDNFTHLLQKRQLCRASDLGWLDVLSGSRFFHGTKPLFTRVDEKTGKVVTDKWKESAMRFGTCAVLYQFGFHPRGTTFHTELGTAALREKVARIMHDRTKALYGEALLHVHEAPYTGKQQAVAGYFQGRGGGNPRHKSCLEALHNLIHNRLGALPGQTGPDVERRPEQLHGMLNESASLLKIYEVLTPYQRDTLKFPTLEYHTEFLPLLNAIYRQIDERTNHNLEGWEACNFLTREFRLHRNDDQWISQEKFLQMPASAQHAIREIVKEDEACQRPSRLSPRAVFQQGLGELIKPHPSILAEILYDDLAEARTVRSGYITFEDKTIMPGEMRFDDHVCTPEGRIEKLSDGEKYETVINPFQPDLLWVYSKRGDGSFLGIAQRDIAHCRQDKETAGRKLAKVRAWYDEAAAPLEKRHADLARAEQRRLTHNREVFDGPTSPEEAELESYRTQRAAAQGGDDSQAALPDDNAIPESAESDHPQFGRFLHNTPNPTPAEEQP